jgi:hypothetical protein
MQCSKKKIKSGGVRLRISAITDFANFAHRHIALRPVRPQLRIARSFLGTSRHEFRFRISPFTSSSAKNWTQLYPKRAREKFLSVLCPTRVLYL